MLAAVATCHAVAALAAALAGRVIIELINANRQLWSSRATGALPPLLPPPRLTSACVHRAVAQRLPRAPPSPPPPKSTCLVWVCAPRLCTYSTAPLAPPFPSRRRHAAAPLMRQVHRASNVAGCVRRVLLVKVCMQAAVLSHSLTASSLRVSGRADV